MSNLITTTQFATVASAASLNVQPAVGTQYKIGLHHGNVGITLTDGVVGTTNTYIISEIVASGGSAGSHIVGGETDGHERWQIYITNTWFGSFNNTTIGTITIGYSGVDFSAAYPGVQIGGFATNTVAGGSTSFSPAAGRAFLLKCIENKTTGAANNLVLNAFSAGNQVPIMNLWTPGVENQMTRSGSVFTSGTILVISNPQAVTMSAAASYINLDTSLYPVISQVNPVAANAVLTIQPGATEVHTMKSTGQVGTFSYSITDGVNTISPRDIVSGPTLWHCQALTNAFFLRATDTSGLANLHFYSAMNI